MHKFVSKYMTAAQLALMAVAPLFLFPFLPPDEVAAVLLWLCVPGLAWIVMDPSCQYDELPHNARVRFVKDTMRDPLFWFLLVVVAYAGLRVLNGGIAVGYDAESMVWSVQPPKLSALPGCVDGTGFLPFAASVALCILLVGIRHALNARSCMALCLAISVFSGASATVAVLSLSYGFHDAISLAKCEYVLPSFCGTAYGVNLLIGLVALFGSVELKWVKMEPLAVLALVGNALGMVVFSPIATTAVFIAVFFVFTVVSFVLSRRALEGSGSFRCAISIIAVLVAVVIYVMMADTGTPVGLKRDAAMALSFFPERFWEMRRVLSSIAFKVWKESPWIGTGLGTFPFDIQFNATAEDWTVISPFQRAVTSGWWQMIAERGIVGALLHVIGAGFLVWTYFAGVVYDFRRHRWNPMDFVGVFVVVALVAVSFTDCSLLRADVLLAAGASLALSSGTFTPRRRQRKLEMED